MDLASVFVENKSKHSQITSEPVLRPQTWRDGMTAVTLSVQRVSPLNILTEHSLLKQLTRGLLPLQNTQESLTIPQFLTPEAIDGYGSIALSL